MRARCPSVSEQKRNQPNRNTHPPICGNCADKTQQIYSTAEPGSGDGASVSVSNSSFIGNVAENHGGAIAAWGQGTVDMSNCSFVGNEVVGVGGYRRAGTGGAVYASPGVFVTVRGRERETGAEPAVG